ncbi:MAG: excinuclease ABC subunit B [candidate division Zixibacteria bacterium RBG_16_50_21]|nr:MAG: excinuclease ABC subunit B [candidate division Zixibacteria bacterium RBG_16_50_21]
MPKAQFKLVSDYQPKGDQPEAIRQLSEGILRSEKFQTLLGVTGSGKTFTMANVIANVGKPTLVISHNKTLAAQLYGELKGFFPQNAVEFFISYYDYYQPEAYIPSTDTYIAKDTSINEDIDRLRLRSTASLFERDDVVIVASVSCIYNLGSPQEYRSEMVFLETRQKLERDEVLKSLIDIHYARNDMEFNRGTFRVRGDVIEIHPAYEETAVRVEMFGDEIEKIAVVNTLTGEILEQKQKVAIYPARHFVTTRPQLEQAITEIELELQERLGFLRSQNKLLEAQRLESRTKYDLEMMQEIGYCSGIENYSRHISGRKQGERPSCLIDFFPQDFLLIIDESHQTIPQIRGMFAGDRSRKEVLMEYGFRLPSALDNRPLMFEEFESMINQVIFVSATPAGFELEKCKGVVVEQLIRPTGIIDPEIKVRPLARQVDDLLEEIRIRSQRKERILVTTLTKRMAEDLADYLAQMDIKVRYLHSEIDAIERVDILRDLRLGEFDVIVGINLLREGLDLPEVSLVAILDADKEGFLRSERSLIQNAGRAARNKAGEVILYADVITESMRKAMQETARRRKIQQEYNERHGIVPQTIYKTREEILRTTAFADSRTPSVKETDLSYLERLSREERLEVLTKEMKKASTDLDFERAAVLRDEIAKLKKEVKAKRST